MRNFKQMLVLSTCCTAILAPLSVPAQDSKGLLDEAKERLEQRLNPPVGAARQELDDVNAPAVGGARQQLQENLNRNNLQVHQFGGRTVVTGAVINRQDITATGEKAEAAGAKIKIQSGNGTGNGQPTVNKTDNKLEVQGAGKVVNVHVNTLNTGNITANASGTHAEANAAGTSIEVQGASAVRVQANSFNQGNVSATASGTQEAIANASGTQIKVEGARSTQIGGTYVNQGNVSASATAGTGAGAPVTPRRGAAAALDRSQ